MVILARINQMLNKDDSLSIARYLEKPLIVFLEEETREEAIASLVERLDVEGKLTDRDRFHQAILEREKIVSTGIGIGVAIPHAKMSHCSDFFIAIGIQEK